MAAILKRLIVISFNVVLLKIYAKTPQDILALQEQHKRRTVHIRSRLVCALRRDAKELLLTLNKKDKLMVWSYCKKDS